MNKKKLKLLIVPVAVASASVIGMVSGTLAYFTSVDKATVSIEAGQVKVDIALSNLKTYSLDVLQKDAAPYTFENGGTASINGAAITLSKITPGDKVTFDLDVTNNSNVDMKYKLKARYANEVAGADPKNPSHSAKLSEGLVVSGLSSVTEWTTALLSTSGTKIVEREVSIEFPKEAGNEYQNATSDIFIEVEAIQNNGPVNSSYGFYDSYKEGGVWYHEITNKAQFQNIMANILETKQGVDYSDPAINDETAVYIIMNDIDFNGNAWHDDVNNVDLDPTSFTFKGTLMGNDLIGSKVTLKNITLGDADGVNAKGTGKASTIALFDRTINATFKNITVRNFVINAPTKDYCSFFVGGNKTAEEGDNYIRFENCEVEANCSIVCNNTGGGFLACGRELEEITFKNCTNRASITTSQNIAAGFLGNASVGGHCTLTFDGCKNYGEMTAPSPAGLSGYAGVGSNKITIKNSGSYGRLNCVAGYCAGIFHVNPTGYYSLDDSVLINENNESSAYIYFTSATGAVTDANMMSNGNNEYARIEGYSSTHMAFTDLNSGKVIDTKAEYLTLCKKGYDKITLGFNSTTKKLETSYANANVVSYKLSMKLHGLKINTDGHEYGDGPAPTSQGENWAPWSMTAASVDALDVYRVERVGFFVPTGFEAPKTEYIPYAKFARYQLDPATTGASYVGKDGYYTDSTDGFGYIIVGNQNPGEWYHGVCVWRSEVTYAVTGYNADGETVAYGTTAYGWDSATSGYNSLLAGMDGNMSDL